MSLKHKANETVLVGWCLRGKVRLWFSVYLNSFCSELFRDLPAVSMCLGNVIAAMTVYLE